MEIVHYLQILFVLNAIYLEHGDSGKLCADLAVVAGVFAALQRAGCEVHLRGVTGISGDL